MLVQESVEVPLAMEDVEQVLAHSEEMSVWAAAAYRRGERLAVGPGVPGVAAAVELDVGEALRSTDAVAIPFAWRAVGAARLFPHMEAELVLAPVDDTRTALTLRGSYRPPLDALGEVIDRLAMHKVAEATVRNFLERLAAAVTESAAAETGLPARSDQPAEGSQPYLGDHLRPPAR